MLAKEPPPKLAATDDLERQIEGATKVKCSEFAKLITEKF